MVAKMPNTQVGVALAVLLWFLAALSLLVASIMSTAKVDVHYARLNTAMAEATALNDGATLLYLNDLTRQHLPQPDLDVANEDEKVISSYWVGDHEVFVRAIPSAGLIHMLSADSETLESLFVVAGGLELQGAEKLAKSVLEWRTLSNASSNQVAQVNSSKVEVLEDLMAVPGMTRDVFDRISLLITASTKQKTEKLNVNVAPIGVLNVLANGDQTSLDQLQESIVSGGIMGSSLIRVDARVKLNESAIYQRSTWVKLSSASKNKVSIVPWEIKRFYPSVAVETVSFDELMYVNE